ncbi:MAG: class I SAM-dependent methyltransferase [Acidimicrobiales bacterium]|jgi:16S rRNA (guanine527-N7)-methyltransferase|nr:class I SAM-dependent methyltransferase [Acidimicrobiales bacterium]
MRQAALVAALRRAQVLGHIGAGDIDNYIQHAQAHLQAAQPAQNSKWCDLGSGGGLPGLVVAAERPDLELTLLDRSVVRTQFLADALRDIGAEENVEVVTSDASELAHHPSYRALYDGVFSRSFGPPSVTVECAVALLSLGGRLVVSEPPEPAEDRWPTQPLRTMGLDHPTVIEGPPRFVSMSLVEFPDIGVPRKWTRISKNPLF